MTIKQQGGVFGRNPTFNDVDVEGTLKIGGSAIPTPADTLTSSDIGSTVQGFDADTAKTDTAQTFTAKQDVIFAGGGNFVARFQNTTSGTPYGVHIKDATGGAAGYPLLTITDGAGSTEYFKVMSGTNPNIVVGKNLAMANGNGIDFSATSGTGTSELFDDYEEGSWSPVLSTGMSSGPSGYTTQRGSYTKVGNLVSAQLEMDADGAVGSAALITLSGLPFTSSANSLAHGGGFFTYSNSFSTGGDVTIHIPASDTKIAFYRNNGNQVLGNDSDVNINNLVMITVVYVAA